MSYAGMVDSKVAKNYYKLSVNIPVNIHNKYWDPKLYYFLKTRSYILMYSYGEEYYLKKVKKSIFESIKIIISTFHNNKNIKLLNISAWK